MNKILIVEDDVDINKALRIRLEAAGYQVCTAEDGYMGLSMAVQEKPDLMILDISMPAGGGFSIVNRMHEKADLPNIPFIVLTASKRPDFKQTATDLGAAAYFEKPYEAGQLLDAIYEVVAGGWHLQV